MTFLIQTNATLPIPILLFILKFGSIFRLRHLKMVKKLLRGINKYKKFCMQLVVQSKSLQDTKMECCKDYLLEFICLWILLSISGDFLTVLCSIEVLKLIVIENSWTFMRMASFVFLHRICIFPRFTQILRFTFLQKEILMKILIYSSIIKIIYWWEYYIIKNYL